MCNLPGNEQAKFHSTATLIQLVQFSHLLKSSRHTSRSSRLYFSAAHYSATQHTMPTPRARKTHCEHNDSLPSLSSMQPALLPTCCRLLNHLPAHTPCTHPCNRECSMQSQSPALYVISCVGDAITPTFFLHSTLARMKNVYSTLATRPAQQPNLTNGIM